jgi:glycosyltransferase involved in cell wall biosynthesis
LNQISATKSENIVICIAAYNEENTIGKVVSSLQNQGYSSVIVVDDGSTDRTSEFAKAAGAHVFRFNRNQGQWAALRKAFRLALARSAEIIVTFDADGQHQANALAPLIKVVTTGNVDFVVASRYLLNNDRAKLHRKFGTRFLNLLMFILTGYRLTDCTSGLNCAKAQLIERVLPRLTENQFGRLEQGAVKIYGESSTNNWKDSDSDAHLGLTHLPIFHCLACVYRSDVR